MPNDGTIASKLQLDGEQQYKKALNDAYRSLRVLRSELKAETAELGKNASQQDKARTKIASLQKQIVEQQKVVKTLEKALADSRKEYAENQEVQDKWAEKLNKAREALANMQNALDDARGNLSDFSGEMKEAADNSKDAMQTVVSFNDAMKSIGGIVGGIGTGLHDVFSSTLDTVKNIVAEMMGLMGMAWATAGEWKDIQEVWGGSLESIERVFTAMELQGVDPSKVTSSIQKLVANVHSGNKETQAALKELGLTESQFTSHWDMFTTVMDRLSKQGYTKGKQWDLTAALFGEKKGSDVAFLLNNWDDAMNKYDKDVVQTGLKKTEDEIQKLDDVGKKITEIQELWETIQETVGAKLVDILQMDERTEEVLNILRDVGMLLSGTGDRKEIILKLSEDIETLMTGISTSLSNLSKFLTDLGAELEQSDLPLVKFIGQLVSGLGDLLDWLTANSGTIIQWLNTLLPYIAANKVSEAVTGKGLGDWLTDVLKLGLDVAVLGKLFGTSAGTAIASGATSMGLSIGAGILKAVPILAGLGVLFHVTEGDEQVESFWDAEGNLTQAGIEAGMDAEVAKEEAERDKKENEAAMKRLEEREDVGLTWDNFWEGLKNMFGLGGRESQETESVPKEEVSLSEMTQAQREAAEVFWDQFRDHPLDVTDEEWEAFAGAFEGQEQLLNALIEKIDILEQNNDDELWRSLENLPANWFNEVSGALKNLTEDNYKGAMYEALPSKIEAAAAKGIASKPLQVSVYLDGDLITRTVDRGLGGSLSRLFGAG